jgi:hypothetical protein
MIVEQVPGKSLKIETKDKNVFVFQLEEVEKITKELIVSTASKEAVERKRRGFIGLSLGANFPLGKFADENGGKADVGLQINLVDFGYKITNDVGIVFMWMGSSNSIRTENSIYNLNEPKQRWTYGCLMIGPLLNVISFKKVEIDLRPMIGYASTEAPVYNSYLSETVASTAFNIGLLMRNNLSKDFALNLSMDYYTTSPEFKGGWHTQVINTITIGVGLAYRIK